MSVSKASKAHVSWYNISTILSLCLASFSYGYDFSIITTTVGQPSFYSSMGLTLDPTQASLYAYSNNMIGTIFGLFSAGAIFGALFTGWYVDAYGRKPALLIAAVINVVGGALQTGSVHVGMFIAARFVTGFAASIFVTLAPIYISEIVPPSRRGLLVGQHGAFFLLGYTVASWVGVGCSYASNVQFQWRFPIAVQMLAPFLMLYVAFTIPESPRWLVANGRNEEAWVIMSKLHFDPNDEQQSFAREELYQIKEQVAADKAAYGNVGILDLFRKPHFRKRMICSAVVAFATQACGIIVIYSNIVGLLRGLEFSNANSLLLSAGYITWACVCNFTCATYIDRLGRVKSMLIGFSGTIVTTSVEAAIDAIYGNSTNRAALAAGVAMLFLNLTFFAAFCDTTLYVYCAEIFPTHIRAKGMAWSIAVWFLATLPFLESSATGFATIGWKYYMIFIALTTVNVALMWWLCPETAGLSLEEINGLFGDEVVVRLDEIAGREIDVLDGETTVRHEVEKKE